MAIQSIAGVATGATGVSGDIFVTPHFFGGSIPTGISSWEALIALPNPEFVILVEVNVSQHYVNGSNWTSEGSSTYSHACTESSVSKVTDNSTPLTVKTSVADVKSNAGSYYFDLYAQKVYVHCVDGDDLSNSSTTVVVMVYSWQYFATKPCIFNNIQYRPIIEQSSLPALDLSVDDIVEGAYKFNFGSFSVLNNGYFDTVAEDYVWTNRTVLVKIGGESLPYGEYQTYFVGKISDFYVSDEEIVFSVKDIRVGTFAQLPIDHYWLTNYPYLEEGADGKPIPILYGSKTNIVPVRLSTKSYTFKFGNREIKSVDKVVCRRDGPNKKVLVANKHYTVDLANSEITLKPGPTFTYLPGDTIHIDATGIVDAGDNALTKGGEIVKDILKTYLGFVDDDLDLASFTATDASRTYALAIYVDTEQSSEDIIQTIGRSIVAFLTPTDDGKLAFIAYEPTTPAGTLELYDADYGDDWKVTKDDSYIRNKVQVKYDKSPETQEFNVVEKENYDVLYKYGVRDTLAIETYIKNAADADTIAEGILDMLSKPITVVETSFGVKGFTLFPTGKIKLTRSRAVDSTGSWTSKVFRIKQIVKDTNLEQTSIVAQDDLQTLGEVFCYVCYSCQLCVAAQSSCSLCYSCQLCVVTQVGCVICNSCQLCFTAQAGCVLCNTCQSCNTCQVSYGTIPCQTCQLCVACQVGYTCGSCNVCQLCNTEQHPVGCAICNTCQNCNTTQGCVGCDVCDTCQLGYTCGSCDTCQICNTAQHPVGCIVCYACQLCNTIQHCHTCDICVACQNHVTCDACDAVCEVCAKTESCSHCDIACETKV